MSTVARMVPRGMPSCVLRGDEDVVPQPRLEVATPSSAGRSTARGRRRVSACPLCARCSPKSTRLPDIGSPSTRRCFSGRCQPRGRTTMVAGCVAERVRLALGRGEVDPAGERVAEVELAGDHVVPERGVGVLEVGQPHLGARVQRVDRHLPVGRPGDLDPAVDQAGRGLGDPPGRVLADVLGLRQEAEGAAGGQLRVAPVRGRPAAPAAARRTPGAASPAVPAPPG